MKGLQSSETSQTVSVVITCYNYAKFIGQAVDSVLAQTYSDFEVIIVNDGSTDHTDDVLKPYLSERKIKYIKQENRGQANAKNNGIRNSTGRLIAFLDADDWWDKMKLEKLAARFSEENTGVVYSKSQIMDSNGIPLDWIYPEKTYSGRITEELFIDNFIPFSSAMIRRECFERAGLFDESLGMGIDWDLWLRISRQYEFDVVDEPLLYYRMGHVNQMSKNMEVRMRCSDRIMEKFLSESPEMLSGAALNRAWFKTYCNRGEYYRSKDLRKSSRYFLKAIPRAPLDQGAYRGLAKNLLALLGIKRAGSRQA